MKGVLKGLQIPLWGRAVHKFNGIFLNRDLYLQ